MARITVQGSGLVKPTRPQYDAGSPEGIINQQAELMRKQIQQEFQTEWDSLNRRAKAAGITGLRHQQIMDKLHERYRDKATAVGQETEQKLQRLGQMDELQKRGGIPSAAETKWRMTLPPEAEAAMFPKQKEPSILDQRLQQVTEFEQAGIMSPEQAVEARRRMKLGPTAASVLYRKPDEPDEPEDPLTRISALETIRSKLERSLGDYKLRKAKPAGFWRGMARGAQAKGKPARLEIWDDEKGEFRKATEHERTIHDQMQEIEREQNILMRTAGGGAISGMMRTTAGSPRMMGGAIQDLVKQHIDTERAPEAKQLDAGTARSILQEADGDPDRAREIARSRGYTF
jgi:hypothetical protein